MQIVNAGVSGWIWDDLEVPGVDTVQIQDVDPINSWGKIVDFGCRTTRNINDVFFWNNHLAFFVGDGGFLCRYSLRPDPHGGPGLNIAKALLADRDPETKEPYLKWEAQGADEQALNWGKIVDEPAYRYANFRSVFCLQVGPINIDEWVAFEMNADLGGSTPHSNLHPDLHPYPFAQGPHGDPQARRHPRIQLRGLLLRLVLQPLYAVPHLPPRGPPRRRHVLALQPDRHTPQR